MSTNEEKILTNTKDIIGLKKDVEYIRASVDSIMNNHLRHIASDIKEMQASISALKIKDSSRNWLVDLGTEAIKTIITSIVIGGLILLGLKNI
jgi:hypothetical protein